MVRLSERELLERIDALGNEISSESYNELSTVRMRPMEADQLPNMDPFSDAYREIAMGLYTRLSQRASYVPELHELSGMGEVPDLWRGSSPFSFGNSKFVSEFLACWAAIFDALDVRRGQHVLEYGSGSGQALLLLARTGVKAFGVDIDAASASLVRRQSELMNLDVEVECAAFGEGFSGRTFDRIFFFEAFHHAFDFGGLLIKLQDRLNRDGYLVFCGEPVVQTEDDSIPFPWGPRMDALSVLCMRRYGWMELGFQLEFFLTALMSCGWTVKQIPNPVARAITYIAKPWHSGRLALGDDLLLPAGWSAPEGSHRWTSAELARIPLPWKHRSCSRLSITLANYLPELKTVRIAAGLRVAEAHIPSGATSVVVLEDVSFAREVTIQSTLSPPPSDTPSPPSDTRLLGIAVVSLELED